MQLGGEGIGKELWPLYLHRYVRMGDTTAITMRSCSKQIVLRSIAVWYPHAQDGLYGRAAVLIPARVALLALRGRAEAPKAAVARQSCRAHTGPSSLARLCTAELKRPNQQWHGRAAVLIPAPSSFANFAWQS